MEVPKINLETHRDFFRVTNEMEKITKTGYGTKTEYANILLSACTSLNQTQLLKDLEGAVFWIEHALSDQALRDECKKTIDNFERYINFISIEKELLRNVGLNEDIISQLDEALISLRQHLRIESYDAREFHRAITHYRESICAAAKETKGNLVSEAEMRRDAARFRRNLGITMTLVNVGSALVLMPSSGFSSVGLATLSGLAANSIFKWKGIDDPNSPRWLR
jgi:hypothetical protein